MRLDRIALHQQSNWTPTNISIFGDQKIGKAYLYPSDHFGIVANLKKSDDSVAFSKSVFYKDFEKMENGTGFRSFKRIVCLRKFIGVALGVLIIGGICGLVYALT